MKAKLFFLLLILFFYQFSFLTASESEQMFINKIIINGLKKCSPWQIRKLLSLKPGSLLKPGLLEQDMTALQSSGFFIEVLTELQPKGDDKVNLIFNLTEQPVIRKLIFQGNQVFSSRRLNLACEMFPGIFVNETKILNDVSLLKAFYRKKGYHDVKIDFSLTTDEALLHENQRDVVFKIVEGAFSSINSIHITGNLYFTEAKLKSLMRTKARGVGGVPAGVFIEEQFNRDLGKIKQFYLDHGFIRFDVSSDLRWNENGIVTPNKKQLDITLNLTEGECYTYSGSEIYGNNLIDSQELSFYLSYKPGRVYNDSLVKKNLAAIKQCYEEAGYPETQVQPEPAIDEEDKTIGYQILITEAQTSYIEAINIEGNEKVRNYVIERTVATEAGDIFNYKKLNESLQALKQLGFFSKVDYKIEPGSLPGLIKLTYQVQEASSIQFLFGLTVSSNRWPPDIGLGARFLEANLAGRQILLDSGIYGSLFRQNLMFKLEDPVFLNSPFSLGVGIGISHNWQQLILREVAGEVKNYYPLGITTETALREYYRENAAQDDMNMNFLGAGGDWWQMGIHQLAFAAALDGQYHFLKHFTLDLNYLLLPYYYFLPVPRSDSRWIRRVNEIDDGYTNLQDYLEEGWIIKSRFALSLIFDTTRSDTRSLFFDAVNDFSHKNFYPLEGIRFSITPAYIWGHFDAVTLDTRFTWYIKLLELDFNGYPFHPVAVINLGAGAVFPGFRNLGGELFGRTTAGNGPILAVNDLLSIDGLSIGRGWGNSLGQQSRTTLADFTGYARLDASLELRLPIYEKIVWLSGFIDMVNLISGANPKESWKWWENSTAYGIDNWYGSTGCGIQFIFPQLPISFYVVKRFKVNYYSGFDWQYDQPETGNLNFILAVTGTIF